MRASVNKTRRSIDDESHHHAGGDGDAPAAVCVRHDVPVADAEEGDGYQPHGVQQVGVLLVMIPDIQINQSSKPE